MKKQNKTGTIAGERAFELLNAIIDLMVDSVGLESRDVIVSLLNVGFTAEELIALKFSRKDVLKLSAEYGCNESEG